MALTTTTTLPQQSPTTGLPFNYNPGEAQSEPLYNGLDANGKPVNYSKRRCYVTGDASYPSGGYSLTPSMFGFTAFYPSRVPEIESESGTAWMGLITPDPKLKLVARGNSGSGAAEVAGTTNVSQYSAILVAYGY